MAQPGDESRDGRAAPRNEATSASGGPYGLPAARDRLAIRKSRADERKLLAEIEKLQQETRNLESERTRIEGDQATRHWEQNKLQSEIARIVAETDKLRADLGHTRSTLRWEKVKGVGSTVLALAAIWTAYNAFAGHLANERTRHRADLSRLIEGLGGKEASQRMAAAIGLRGALDDSEPMRPTVVHSLAYSIGLETNPAVQQAIAESLVIAGPDALVPLRRVLPRVNGEVVTGWNRVEYVKLDQQKAQEQDIIRARQGSMVAVAMAIASLDLAAGGRLNFAGLNFKDYPFYGVSADLKRAKFNGATLWKADFYGMHLDGADFTLARAEETTFRATNLPGAIFVEADLYGADFTGATGLTADQLGKARDLTCAVLDAPLRDRLKARTQPKSGKACPS